ncbi:4a-hydroxytetrahydrobiopterin dehydratase [Aquabacterium commune]|uniref:Putative pterin-4-alpha-carbinolamine dehydratase n=1 Tax=Aquabacterium commune TaxID=70586 RepID=A0A4R6RNQ4_9BURK|nr:4a-hydroxytetrahydrobiopterin dehydratase [Aquabacterium commune]TDP88369.1 4a-hydroxytetrahydrobiopterin dehydratase [Aquabacterium commune]
MHTPPSHPTPLLQQRCSHQTGPALDDSQAASLLTQLTAWDIQRAAQGDSAAVVLTRTFTFSDFHRTMAFVNAVAWIVHEQDHHPDLTVGYSRCTVNWSTHSVGGLSVNDFICAARIDALVA